MQDLANSNGSCEHKVITSGKDVNMHMYIHMLQTWYVKYDYAPDPILAIAINAMNKACTFLNSLLESARNPRSRTVIY